METEKEDFNLSDINIEFKTQNNSEEESDSTAADSEPAEKDPETQNNSKEMDGIRNETPLPETQQSEISDKSDFEEHSENALTETAAQSDPHSLSSEQSEEEEDSQEENEYDFENLPPHSCLYCGIHSVDSVVQCVDCGKWFCNNKGTTTGAHIINHLVRSQHKRVALHKDTLLGKTVLECFNCGGRNVFLLGFIPAKEDSIIVLLCREPCLGLNSLKEMNWDLSQWVPLIKERSFLPWLVQKASDREQNRAYQATAAQIRKVEELWKNGDKSAKIRALEQIAAKDAVEAVQVRYEDAYAYAKIYLPLIDLECDFDKKTKEEQEQRGVEIRWEGSKDPSDNKNLSFYFQIDHSNDNDTRVVRGDEIQITYPKDSLRKAWTARGVVVNITVHDEIFVQLENNVQNAPTSQSFGFNIEFIWKSIPYDRMRSAIRSFVTDDYSITGYLYHALLGHEMEQQKIMADVPEDLNAPGLPKLNASQKAAVEHSLTEPLSLIQGPPGTGKTLTSATLVYHLAMQNRGKVLVCAPSNISADQLTSKIHETGLKVVRLASHSREVVCSFVDFLYLHNLCEKLSKETDSRLFKLIKLKKIQGSLSNEDHRDYRVMMKDMERDLLSKADVIVTTCVCAGDPRLLRLRFKQVLIDESTQATESEVLIPMMKGAKQVILVGDHCQLGPVVMSNQAEQAGFERSLFERLIMLGTRPMRLQVQYRMHPCLSEFPSDTFYEGSLQNGVSSEERRQSGEIKFEWPNADIPMMFYSVVGSEEFSASGTSYLNRLEAVTVEKVVTKMVRGGVDPEDIGIITPYEGQRQYIAATMLCAESLKKEWVESIEIESVNSFQGREKDYIILSCVRSNDNLGIGFLKDPRRLNVALTRAKYGLVIVGNPRSLSVQPLWHSLVSHFKKQRLLVEGPLENLSESFIELPKSKQHFERRKIMPEEKDDPKEYDRGLHSSRSAFCVTVPDAKSSFESNSAQYLYAHPGEIHSRPGNNRQKETSALSFDATQVSQRSTSLSESIGSSDYMSLDETEADFADRASLGRNEEGTFMTPGEEDFTQHVESQKSSFANTQESELNIDLENLSLGGNSQEFGDTEDDED